VVGRGVTDHSNFRADPWRRLVRTVTSVNRLVFAPAAIAASESERLRRMHAGIHGVDEAGRPYHALAPEAYAWVHLTLVHFLVDVQRVLGRPLTSPDREQLYREWRQVGRLLGVPARHVPPDWSTFRRYFDDTVVRTLGDNQAVRDVLTAVTRPAKPVALLPSAVWAPVADRTGSLLLLFTVGTLPPVLRARLGLSWTARDAANLDRHAGVLRAMLPVGPPLPAWPYLIRARLVGFG
jgi:uncharacterized protein (DUF2236 family)